MLQAPLQATVVGGFRPSFKADPPGRSVQNFLTCSGRRLRRRCRGCARCQAHCVTGACGLRPVPAVAHPAVWTSAAALSQRTAPAEAGEIYVAELRALSRR